MFPSYWVTGILIVILSWMMSACRLGNKVTEKPDPPSSFTGFYQTEPSGAQALKFCTHFQDDTSQCQFANAAINTPAFVKFAMVNPVAFQVKAFSDGTSALFDINNKDWALPVNVSSELALIPTADLFYEGAYPPTTAWDDPDCLFQFQVSESGKVNRNQNGVLNGIPTQGRIENKITIYQVFNTLTPNTDCKNALAGIEACYFDLGQCGASPSTKQAWVKDIFEDHIQSGGLDPTKISEVLYLEYSVQYK